MKTIMVILILFAALQARSQTVIGSIFNQQNNEKKSMVQQILFTKTYREALKAGYNICKVGWNTVKGFKDGEYNLHDLFFTSLEKVNPVVKKYVKVPQIIRMQMNILSSFSTLRKHVSKSENLSPKEIRYVGLVCDCLLEDCEHAIEQLAAIVSDSQLEMKDDERIERLDILYEEMLDRRKFSQDFAGGTLDMLRTKNSELKGISTLKAYTNIE